MCCRYNLSKELCQEKNVDQTIICEDNIKIFEKIDCNQKQSSIYCTLASRVQTKRHFVKVAYPDMIAANCVPQPHYLISNYSKFSRYISQYPGISANSSKYILKCTFF